MRGTRCSPDPAMAGRFLAGVCNVPATRCGSPCGDLVSLLPLMRKVRKVRHGVTSLQTDRGRSSIQGDSDMTMVSVLGRLAVATNDGRALASSPRFPGRRGSATPGCWARRPTSSTFWRSIRIRRCVGAWHCILGSHCAGNGNSPAIRTRRFVNGSRAMSALSQRSSRCLAATLTPWCADPWLPTRPHRNRSVGGFPAIGSRWCVRHSGDPRTCGRSGSLSARPHVPGVSLAR